MKAAPGCVPVGIVKNATVGVCAVVFAAVKVDVGSARLKVEPGLAKFV